MGEALSPQCHPPLLRAVGGPQPHRQRQSPEPAATTWLAGWEPGEVYVSTCWPTGHKGSWWCPVPPCTAHTRPTHMWALLTLQKPGPRPASCSWSLQPPFGWT